MKINELKDKEGNVNIDLVIIWDKSTPERKFGKIIKSVIVKDADSMHGDNSPSAYLDLYDEAAENYTVGDRIRVIDAYSKKITGKSQFRIVNAHEVQKLESVEEIREEQKEKVDTEQQNKFLAEWITINYGGRCKDYNTTCAICKAWDYYAKLKYD